MEETLTSILQKWESDMRYGTRKQRVVRAEKWIPYYTYLCEQAAGKPFDSKGDPTGFLAVLREKDVIRPRDTVLDIGAGTGDYSLRLARHVHTVTALEMNAAGISVLMRRASEEKIGNIRQVQSFWEYYEPEESFDVVFTSMCPVICNREEIEKMERLSNRACCIITVLPGSYDLHRRQMMRELDLHPEGMITDGERYRKILTAMGRNVELITRETVSRHTVSFSDALKRFSIYFQIFGMTPEKTESYLRDYFDRNAVNGVLEDESRMRFALLIWNK